MKRCISFLMSIFILIGCVFNVSKAETKRIMQLSNDKVLVWETIVYPGPKQVLKMHRHDHDRVVYAFDEGVLKITNDKGKVHYLKFEKDKAYFLTKNVPNELHSDENISSHPIKVLVVEVKE